MVKVGDIVRCVDNSSVSRLLTNGNEYEVLEVNDDYIYVNKDDGDGRGAFFHDRFELVQECRTFDKRGSKLFNKVSKVINGERQTSYGNPEDSFAWIAQRWNQYLQGRFGADFELTAEDATFMMADFKMARECNQHKADNIIDCTGYLGINFDMTERD